MIAMAGNVENLRPHVKTHKLAEVVAMKRRRGIRRFKAATIAEAEMTAAAGGEDVLLAYPIVGPNIERFLNLMKAFEQTRFSALVDDAGQLREISRLASLRPTKVRLLMDLDVGMHRTGFALDESHLDQAFDFYQSMIATPHIETLGLHAYDGHVHESDPKQLRSTIKKTFAPVWQLCERIANAKLPSPQLVLAGTPTSGHLAEMVGFEMVDVEIGSIEVGAGTTVLWDAGQPRLSPDLDFLNAAVVVSRVISRPTAQQLCLDLGHKAVASEMPSPRVHWLNLPDAIEVLHSEEHMVVESPAADRFPVGTLLYGLPTHICPTMALHQDVGVVRNRNVTERWTVAARDRRITI